MSRFKLRFEKEENTDFLELPILYSTCEGGLTRNEAWKEYLKVYGITRRRIDFYIENLSKLKDRLEEDFNDTLEYLSDV